jgi:hypothetical protein
VKYAERVCEARVFRALICEEREAELLDAAQALKLRGVNQAHDQLPIARIRAKTNDVVDGVAINAFLQAFSIFPVKEIV